MSLLAHELSGTAVFLTAFACVMAGAEILARRNLLAAETSRKAVHLLGGLICLCFPFLLSSWISVLVLALTTALLSALLLAILLAGFEAISIGGTDNIFVPVATCYLLLKVTDKPPQELLFQCISLVGVALLLFKINNRRRTFTTRSQIIFLLFSYAAWSLGSADWMLPVVAGFIIYQLVTKSCDALRNTLGARELLRPLLPHLVILFVANITMQHDFWFAPFLISAAVTTALCAELRFLSDNPPQRLRGTALLCAAVLPTLIPLLLCLPFQGWAVIRALPLLLMISISFTYLYHCAVQLPVNPFVMNYSLPLVSAAAGGICALLQVWGVLKPLDPMTWAEVFR